MLFTFLHLLCNYNAVSSLILDRLNAHRATSLIDQFLQNGSIPTPEEENACERLITCMFLNPWLQAKPYQLTSLPTYHITYDCVSAVNQATLKVVMGIPLSSVCHT